MLYLSLFPQFLIGFYFLFFGLWNGYHWKPTIEAMVSKKIPFASPLLAFGIFLQSIAGTAIILGIGIKIAAAVLIPFDLVAVFIFHNFWCMQGEIRRLNMIIFISNTTATLGALILLLMGSI